MAGESSPFSGAAERLRDCSPRNPLDASISEKTRPTKKNRVMNEEQTILIVDDKHANLVALERLLERSGAKILRASSGNEALAISLRNQLALAILDVQMPEMDGFELATLLTSRPENQSLPIIFVSAVYTDPSHQYAGYGAGAIDFLIKPYDPEVLLAKVDFFLLLDRQRQLLLDRIAIEESNNYLEGILTAMTDAVIVCGDDLSIRTVNDAAEKLLAREESELLGRPVNLIFSHGECPFDPQDRAERKSESKIRFDDLELVRSDGRGVPVILNISFMGTGDSLSGGFVLTAIDITEQKKAQTERAQLEEQLRHAQRLESVGRLAGGVAHDFNNLLTVIFACCEFMSEKLGPSDPLTTEIDDILEASTRGADLVRQLLAFGHKQILRPEIVEPNDIVDRTAKMLRRTIGEHIQVSTELVDKKLLISVDPVQLTQVLMNLGVNARDAMPQGGELRFSTSIQPDDTPRARNRAVSESQFFRIEVSDTGYGMTPQVLERIFEPFFSTKKPGEGTGLGLSVAHGIVAQSGGSISAESTMEEGSKFIINFPLKHDEQILTSAKTNKREQGFHNGTVLVVDDDETIQKVVARSLRTRGYQVVQANNLEDALELARRSKVQILLTDVVMPGQSGPDVARALLEETPDMAVVFMSGHAHDLLGHHGVEAGQVSFIQKPFLPDTLLRLLADVMKGESKTIGLPS